MDSVPSSIPTKLFDAPTLEQIQAAGELGFKYKKQIVGERIIYWYAVPIGGNCNCR